jgi:hypothetical protein
MLSKLREPECDGTANDIEFIYLDRSEEVVVPDVHEVFINELKDFHKCRTVCQCDEDS